MGYLACEIIGIDLVEYVDIYSVCIEFFQQYKGFEVIFLFDLLVSLYGFQNKLMGFQDIIVVIDVNYEIVL